MTGLGNPEEQVSDVVSVLRGGVGPGKILILRNPERAFSEIEEAKLVSVVCIFFVVTWLVRLLTFSLSRLDIYENIYCCWADPIRTHE